MRILPHLKQKAANAAAIVSGSLTEKALPAYLPSPDQSYFP